MNFLFPYMARWKAINWTRYHQIFTRLAQLGHQVHVIQAPPNNFQETNFLEINVELPENLHLHEVEVNHFLWNGRFPLNKLVKKGYYSLHCIRKVEEIIKENNIDVLFLYNLPQYPLMSMNSCLKVFDLADDYLAMLEHELGRFNNGFILKIGEYLLERMIEKSDITFAVSQVLADSIQNNKNDKIKILPNGVGLNGAVRGCGAEIRAQYQKPIIGFIGSFEYFIDFDLILRTAEKIGEYTFLLIGTGREFTYVKNQIKDKGLSNVVLTGGVPHSEIINYIDAMDICLNVFKNMPISHSACPIKLFEYLSMKKPVISTRLKEIENIDDGFLFYADTMKEMHEQIRTIFTNKELAEKRTEKGYILIKTKYQWDAIVNNLLDSIESKRKK